MNIVAFLLSALLFACVAQSRPYSYGLPRGDVRVAHNVPHQTVRVVATHRNHARVVVVYRAQRPAYRRVAVVAYRPHTVYSRHFHRHNRRCHH